MVDYRSDLYDAAIVQYSLISYFCKFSPVLLYWVR